MNNGNLRHGSRVEGSAPGLAASCLPTLSEGPMLVKSHSPGSRYMGRITVVIIRHVGGSCGSIQHMAEKAVAGGGLRKIAGLLAQRDGLPNPGVGSVLPSRCSGSLLILLATTRPEALKRIVGAHDMTVSAMDRSRRDRLRPLSSATDLTDITYSTIEADVGRHPHRRVFTWHVANWKL